jgi:zinc transport system permease protein
MLDLFSYSFIIRGFEAGLIIAVIAPLIGIFLVLRRYSLIADTLSHVSLAGIAIGLLLQINPLLSAIGVSVLSSVLIERLRVSKRVYSETALSIFLSGSLALAIVLMSLNKGFNVNIFNYLFGSLVTVKQSDIVIIGVLGAIVLAAVIAFYKELVFTTFDEEAAQVSGIPTKLISMLLIILSALTVSLAIPIVGVLLISAMIVIPVVTALQYKMSFLRTLLLAEAVSICSVIFGIIFSFYANLSTGGTIVLITILLFIIAFVGKKLRN